MHACWLLDDREKLRVGDCSLGCLEAAVYNLPESIGLQSPGYAHTTVVRLCDHRPANLPSLPLVTAMQPVSHDVDVPPLASTVVKPQIRARHSVQEHSYGNRIVQRRSLGEAVDRAVGMGEEHEEVVEHLAQVLRRRRCFREARPLEQGLLDLPRRQDLMGEVQRYQRRFGSERTVREDRFRSLGVTLFGPSAPDPPRIHSQNRRPRAVALT